MTTQTACLLGAPVDLDGVAIGRVVDVLVGREGAPLLLRVRTEVDAESILVPFQGTREAFAGGVIAARGPFLAPDALEAALFEYPGTVWATTSVVSRPRDAAMTRM